VSRVLVARLDSFGDVLLAGPAVRAIAASREVVLLCSSRGAPAARLLPGVQEVIVWDSPWVVTPPPAVELADVKQIVARLGSLDEAVILTSFHQSPLPLALLLRLAGVARITGASVDYPGSLLDVRLRPGENLDEDQPESERALAIAAAAGYLLPDGDDRLLAVRRGPDVRRLVGDTAYLVVHPGADAQARRWPVEHYVELVRLLTRQGHRVLVTGSDSETELTAEVAGELGENFGGQLTLPELAGVLASADAVVVGNTGPAHLAAAVRTPVVSLFSPVVPAVKWAPYGVPARLLGDQNAPCKDTRARDCPIPGHPCLSGVTPQEVLAAVEDLLDQTGHGGRQQ